MRKIYSFHGGIHPPENKHQSTQVPIKPAPLPPQLIIPVQQHIGAPAEPCVAPGERVKKGQTIARASSYISADIHAPSSGIIQQIETHPVPHPSGLEAQCIFLDTDGKEEWIEHAGLQDYTQLSRPDLIQYIQRHGIAGMGGAGFPTAVKLNLGEDHIVNTLIINAAECEPYITADDMLMRQRPEQIVSGIEIIHHLLKPSLILIGIEDNKPQAIKALENAITNSNVKIELVVVPTRYPSGGEKQLIQLLTGVEVPSGKIPADVGIVCQNVGTVAAIHQAVKQGVPLISRIVTLTGKALKPQNLEVLIGTPVHTLLTCAEPHTEQLARLVLGGPMMGFTLDNPQVPVIKTTNCLIAATEQELPTPPPAQACIRCGMCEQACPAELLPQQLYWFAKSRELDKARHHNLFDCIECGACSYVCPSNIPLVQYYRYAKGEIRAEIAEQRKAEQAKQRYEARLARKADEQAEKEARRKARAAEAASKQSSRSSATPAPATVDKGQDLKALKTAAAVARTKLKKARQALKAAEDKGQNGLDTLQATVKELEQKSQAAQNAYEQAESSQPTSNPLTELQAEADKARTTWEKARQALQNARENASPAADKMAAGTEKLKQKYEAAQAALETARQSPTPAPEPAAQAPAPDTKALKQQVSIMRTKLKKAEKHLAEAESPNDKTALEQEISRLEALYQDAKTQLDKAEAAQNASAAAAGVDLKQLKIDAALARAAVTKAERALNKSPDDSPSEERARLEADLNNARAQAEKLNHTLSQHE